jgi:isohexenylglutaconyl-CoA hydratase
VTTHDFQNILVCREASRLYVTLNRPDVKNALSDDLVAELSRLVDDVAPDRSIRTLILRGAGGTFCAGADIKGFRESFAAPPPADGLRDPIAVKNRSFGAFLQKFNEIPQTTIGVVEGAAFGGGLGLTCIFDVVICHKDTKFSLSETGLGIPPAQIAPFVVRRVGMTNARRLALVSMGPWHLSSDW